MLPLNAQSPSVAIFCFFFLCEIIISLGKVADGRSRSPACVTIQVSLAHYNENGCNRINVHRRVRVSPNTRAQAHIGPRNRLRSHLVHPASCCFRHKSCVRRCALRHDPLHTYHARSSQPARIATDITRRSAGAVRPKS